MDRVFRYRRGTHLRIGDRNRTSRANAGLAAIGDASVDCAVVRFGTDGHRIRATFAQLPPLFIICTTTICALDWLVLGLKYSHITIAGLLSASNVEIISNVLNIAAIAVIAFSWAKDDDTGNTDNTKL